MEAAPDTPVANRTPPEPAADDSAASTVGSAPPNTVRPIDAVPNAPAASQALSKPATDGAAESNPVADAPASLRSIESAPEHPDSITPSGTAVALGAAKLNALVEKFVQSYEAGDISRFTALFTDNAEIDGGKGRAYIRSEYQPVFSATTERRLILDNMDWYITDKGSARGSGEAVLSVRNSWSKERRLAGKVSFVAVPIGREPRISSFHFRLRPASTAESRKTAEKRTRQPSFSESTATQTSGVSGEAGRLALPAAESAPVRRPEAGPSKLGKDALADLIHTFLTTYQQGRLDEFVDLFTAHAKINDGRGHDAIRRDYASLFSSTEYRQLLIRNLNWEIATNGGAVGFGEAKLKIKSNLGLRREYSGELTFAVVAEQGQPKISLFLHKLDQR
jgi:hypothetical protein